MCDTESSTATEQSRSSAVYKFFTEDYIGGIGRRSTL